MRKILPALFSGALSTLFLIAQVEASPVVVNGFNPSNPYYPEEYYSYHVATGVDVANAMIELEDGSQWKAADADCVQLLSWRQGDITIITPNHSFGGSDYTFYITNQANESYVRVNLINGPLVGSANTMLITGMDANSNSKRAIYLNNGTNWKIDSCDFRTIDSWNVHDPVIVGRNDAWFTNHGTILINVLTNTYVRAKKI